LREKEMKKKYYLISIALILIHSSHLLAKPVDKNKATIAAKTFLTVRYPTSDPKLAKTSTKKGKSAFRINEVQPLIVSGIVVGYINKIEPSGFILLAADDQAPPQQNLQQ
jgi:hypothetical protein